MLVMMINDSALSVYRDGDIAYEEPGMAIVTNDEISEEVTRIQRRLTTTRWSMV